MTTILLIVIGLLVGYLAYRYVKKNDSDGGVSPPDDLV